MLPREANMVDLVEPRLLEKAYLKYESTTEICSTPVEGFELVSER